MPHVRAGLRTAFARRLQINAIDGGSNTVNIQYASDVVGNIAGNGDVVNAASGGAFGITGINETVNAASASVYLGSNTQINAIDGGSNTVNVQYASDVVGNIAGNGEVVNAGNGGAFGITGTNETVNGTSSEVYLGANTEINGIDGNSNTINIQSASDVVNNIAGNGEVVNAGNGGAFGITGTNETVNAASSEVYLGANTEINGINGNSNTVNIQSASDVVNDIVGNGEAVNAANGGNFGISGTDERINASGSNIDVLNGSSVNLSGGNDTVSLGGSGDYLGLLGGSYTVSGTGDRIDTSGGTDFNLSGGHDTVDLGGTGDYLGLLGGSGYKVNGSNDTINTWADTGLEVVGNGDQVNVGADSTFISDGTGNVLNGIDVSNGQTYDTNGTDSVTGGAEAGTGYYGYYGYVGAYGLAGKQAAIQSALGSNIGMIAQYDLSIGDHAGASAAEAALHQAQEAAAAKPTSGTGTAVFESAKWDSHIVTWSLGANMGSQYDTDVQHAFATWAAASGLIFEEVSDPAHADIEVSFGDLNTATSGVAAYTKFKAAKGYISHAAVELEAPTQDALVSDGSGQRTYADTDATFEQVLLHEIGHAIGLADDSDRKSVMYYELNGNNKTLDDTDTIGIHSLYGHSTTKAGSTDIRIGRMIQAMASYDVSHSTSSVLASGKETNIEAQLAPVH